MDKERVKPSCNVPYSSTFVAPRVFSFARVNIKETKSSMHSREGSLTIEPPLFSFICKVVLKSLAMIQLCKNPTSLIPDKDSQHSTFSLLAQEFALEKLVIFTIYFVALVN